MPRAQRSKLANPRGESAPQKEGNALYNNGKKQLTGAARGGSQTPRAELSGNPDSAGTGTRRAIKDKVLGAATTAPAAGQITRPRESQPARKIGEFTVGPVSKVERNRKGRRSTALRLSEVRNIMAAAVFTLEEHRPLNRHTTIHFNKCGIADPVAALRRYTKLARDWLKTQGAPFAYIWVRESGDRKGEHAHLLMHVPTALIAAFARRERSWRKLMGAKRALRSFRSTPVGRSYRHAQVVQWRRSSSCASHLGASYGASGLG